MPEEGLDILEHFSARQGKRDCIEHDPDYDCVRDPTPAFQGDVRQAEVSASTISYGAIRFALTVSSLPIVPSSVATRVLLHVVPFDGERAHLCSGPPQRTVAITLPCPRASASCR